MNDLGKSAESLQTNAVNYLTIGENHAGQRLDNFLVRELKGVPKSHIYRIIRGGEVRVNSKRCDAKDKLEIGDKVRIPPIRVAALQTDSPRAAPQGRRFNHPILFEDDALIAINKPAGLAVHGGSGVSYGVIEQLRLSRPEGDFLELVHRLDRETSGILLIAKRRPALLRLHETLREDTEEKPDKRYFAYVQHRVPHDRQHVKAALLKFVAPNNERRVRVDEGDGQASHTILNVVKRFKDATLLEAELKTGRTHQIRVHCAHIGHVIAGDDKYGDFAWNKALTKTAPPLKRMFLHAAKLSFPHPISGDALVLEAPLPPELQLYLTPQV